MSKLLGTGPDACLVAGGPDAPEAVSRRRAVRHLLRGIWLYGQAEGRGQETAERGWRGLIFDALAELHPEAAAHLAKHNDSTATWELYGADPALGDVVDTVEEAP